MGTDERCPLMKIDTQVSEIFSFEDPIVILIDILFNLRGEQL